MFHRPRWNDAERHDDDALALLILKLLEEKMDTAIELVRRLEERFGSRLAFDASDVYPMLQYLEDRGFVSQEPIGAGKVYAVTEAGFAYMAEQARPADAPGADDGWAESRGEHDHGHHGPHHGFGGRGFGRHGGWHAHLHAHLHHLHQHHQAHHHHHQHHRSAHDFGSLMHDMKDLMRTFKHAMRAGRLTPERVSQIQGILRRAQRDIEDTLHGPAAQGRA